MGVQQRTPLTDHSRALNLTSQGVTVLFTGKHSIVWSSSNKTSSTSNLVAQLLDSGNFVVKDGSNENSKILWQSFDYPGDTLLPGMKIGWDLKTGLNRFLSSWKGAEDPAPGQFSFSIDRSGYPQLVVMNGCIPHFRLSHGMALASQEVLNLDLRASSSNSTLCRMRMKSTTNMSS